MIELLTESLAVMIDQLARRAQKGAPLVRTATVKPDDHERVCRIHPLTKMRRIILMCPITINYSISDAFLIIEPISITFTGIFPQEQACLVLPHVTLSVFPARHPGASNGLAQSLDLAALRRQAFTEKFAEQIVNNSPGSIANIQGRT